LEKRPPHIVKGTAVFLTSDPAFVPTAMLHNLKHNKVLHEHNVILTIETAHTPRVDSSERVRMEKISDKFSKVKLRFGFMESPNVPKALAIARKLGWQFDIMSTSFFVSRRSLKPSTQSGMPRWRDPPVHCAQPLGQRCDGLLPNSDRASARSRNPSQHLKQGLSRHFRPWPITSRSTSTAGCTPHSSARRPLPLHWPDPQKP